MSAAMARLRMYYAVRIGALMLSRRGDPSAALAVLELERDAAIVRLCEAIQLEKKNALRAARQRTRRRRYRIVAPAVRAFVPTARPHVGRLRRPGYPSP
jgi:hypothetical protein